MADKETLKQEIWEQSKEWIDGIGQVVNEMASKLGVASQHVYEVYTRQMFVEGIITFVIGLAFLIATLLFFFKIIVPAFKNSIIDVDEEMSFFLGMLGSGVCLAITLGSVFWGIEDGFLMMMNPEYYTMKDLLESVKGLISE